MNRFENRAKSNEQAKPDRIASLEQLLSAVQNGLNLDTGDQLLYTYEELMAKNEKEANLASQKIRTESENNYKHMLCSRANLNKKWTFSNLERNPTYDQYINQAFQFIKSFVQYSSDPLNCPAPNLIITGPSGSGKSHFAGAITHKLIEMGFEPFYTTFNSLMDSYFNNKSKDGGGYNSSDNWKSELLDKIKSCRIFILEDIITNSTNVKSFFADFLSNILRSRSNMNLSTVITSSYTLPLMHEYLGDYSFGSIQELQPKIMQLPEINHRGFISNYDPTRHQEISMVNILPQNSEDRSF